MVVADDVQKEMDAGIDVYINAWEKALVKHLDAVDAAAKKGEIQRYSDDQPRDDHGRWTSDGGGDSGSAAVAVHGTDKEKELVTAVQQNMPTPERAPEVQFLDSEAFNAAYSASHSGADPTWATGYTDVYTDVPQITMRSLASFKEVYGKIPGITNEQLTAMAQQIATHEYAHTVDGTKSNTSTWRDAFKAAQEVNRFPSIYTKVNATEAFAESMSFKVLDPKGFSDKYPELDAGLRALMPAWHSKMSK